MRNEKFGVAVNRFLDALRNGDSFEALWEELLEDGTLNDADLHRALQRAEQIEAEQEGW